MATGLSTKLTGQIGEHLVTAELGRLGIIATPFSGNVPDIDILAYANGAARGSGAIGYSGSDDTCV